MLAALTWCSYFNSRLHGRRPLAASMLLCRESFQLTPSRKATSRGAANAAASIFQLTPSRKATYKISPSSGSCAISTHAFTEGDDLCSFAAKRAGVFQLTPSRKATLPQPPFSATIVFQLTPSRKATANSNNFCC